MESTLSERQRRGRAFAAAAHDYERGRPDWPVEVLDAVSGGLGLRPTATVVDLGAGTGRLTRLLAARFARVIAVEPLAEMRELLAARVPGAELREGTAEHLPLGDGEVDAVFVAEAFHWFDAPRALAEVARVLRPEGGVALLWNLPDGSWEPPLPAPARDLIRQAVSAGGVSGGEWLRRGGWRDAFADAPFEPPRRVEAGHEHVLDRAGLIANVMSVSSVAGLPSDERDRLRARLAELIPEGTYRQRLRTEAYWARSTAAHWCDRCGGALREGSHEACAAARALEPPRYCPRCRRRMKVQVLPAGWRAACVAHGETSGL